ncbi:endoplasmic reticulum membrane-associated RNA degradation protein-like [Elysia marginata]|uniref:Endoplasmic reticulum membrane-associated RNA degradation protein-like n=1 Tax=Elysia marginata TaxID=1093978 RepID=A0AAV4GGN9_9GAST|nr:endoplasmic reticulum membrane-associated RNA degradation protein-like [Elysia marginata]
MAALSKFATATTTKEAEGQINLAESLRSPFSTNGDDVKILLSSMKIKTLYRWKIHAVSACETNHLAKTEGPPSARSEGSVGESEVIGLLMHIVEEAQMSIVQTSAVLKLRCQQLAQKELRSRQRDNLKRLLAFAPSAGLLINYVIYLTTWILSNVCRFAELTQRHGRTLQKQLRSTLKTMENIRTYTAPEKNKWNEAGELLLSEVTSFCDKCEKLRYFQIS